ncbi:NAD(P)H-binding protein, partial [Candidatus Sumerlaeota bacterium]|nr:NAD(P)H-binding protein [Candidatus Sumerlaeota bacterium]
FLFMTGATGHTGARAAARLLDQGWRIRALVRTEEHRRHLPASDRLEIVPGDIADANSPDWIGAMLGAAAVLHLAHIGFAPRIVEACRAAEVDRLICMSSTRRFTQFPEATARLVIEGEAAVEASALQYTILRPSMIYGGARDNNVEKLVGWLRRRRVIPLIRGGRNLVQPIFVDDLVEAIARAIVRPNETARRTLTLAGPEPITQRRMIEIVAEAMNVKPLWIPVPFWWAFGAAALLELKPGRPLATRDQVRRLLEDKAFDISEARDALGGWTSRSFEEGIRLKLAGFYP